MCILPPFVGGKSTYRRGLPRGRFATIHGLFSLFLKLSLFFGPSMSKITNYPFLGMRSMPYVGYDPRPHEGAHTHTTRPRSCSRPRGTQGTGPTQHGASTGSVGRALGLLSRELWQITKGRRLDLTRNSALQLPREKSTSIVSNCIFKKQVS